MQIDISTIFASGVLCCVLLILCMYLNLRRQNEKTMQRLEKCEIELENKKVNSNVTISEMQHKIKAEHGLVTSCQNVPKGSAAGEEECTFLNSKVLCSLKSPYTISTIRFPADG